MTRIVEIRPYNPDWPQMYAAYATAVTPIFGQNLIAAYHIGSTAVVGLPAKPTIDMMIIVNSIAKVDQLGDKMAALGYSGKGEYGITGRRYFQKVEEAHHLAHVHVYELGNPEIERHLQFRDYLRAHPAARDAYAEVKQALAQQYRTESTRYTDAKTSFVQTVERIARHWEAQTFRLKTERLHLIPLTFLQLHLSLKRPLRLERQYNLPIVTGLFNGTVRNAIKAKIGKLRLAEEDQFRWYTYWLLVAQPDTADRIGIGLVGFKGEPNLDGTAEIGYGLDAAYEGRGYMTEAVQALTQWGLAQPNCHTIQADTLRHNIGSQRVLQKNGFTCYDETESSLYWRK